jgi:hypothetical protein
MVARWRQNKIKKFYIRSHQNNILFFWYLSQKNWASERNFYFCLFSSQKLNFLNRHISEASDTFFVVDNVVCINIIVKTASVQCPRLQGCLLYICNSRGTLVLFYWWIGNRVKLNRLCVSYCFNMVLFLWNAVLIKFSGEFGITLQYFKLDNLGSYICIFSVLNLY